MSSRHICLNNAPQIEASFDKINPTVRRVSHARPRPQVCRRRSGGAPLGSSKTTQWTVECRPPTTEGMPGIARHSLGSLPLVTFTPPPGASQGPARPQQGAGRFILALTGGRAVEYPPAGANALTAGAVWRGGVKGAFSLFPAWALTRGLWTGYWGALLLSGRISVIPAYTFG